MSNDSIPNNGSFRQDPAHTKQIVDSLLIGLVAEALYRFDSRNPTGRLAELDPSSQDPYIADAAVAVYMRDPSKLRAALYFAADGITNGGVGSISYLLRQHVVRLLEVALGRFRNAVAGKEPARVAEFETLVEADDQETRRLAEANAAEIASKQMGDVAPGTVM